MSSRIATLLFAVAVFVNHGLTQVSPPPIQWQSTYGGTADDFLFSARQLSDGGYALGGRSISNAGTGTKASPNYGAHDFWVVRLDSRGNQLWDRTFGGSNLDELRSLRETADGGLILAGHSQSMLDGNKTSMNAGPRDFWVVRLNADGNRIWERTYGGTGTDTGFVIRQLPSGGFILGGTSDSPSAGIKSAPHYGMGDFWLVRLDPNGNPLWDRSFGTAGNDELHSLEVLPDGGFILGGSSPLGASGNKQSPNTGGTDFWVIRLDSNGQIAWERSYGGGNTDILHGIVGTEDGGFLLGGFSDSTPLGPKTSPNYGGTDLWVVRIDGTGNKLWDKSFGGSGNDGFEKSFGIDATFDDGFILGVGTGGHSAQGNKTASNLGGNDIWLVRLEADGDKLWDTAYGAGGTDLLGSLQQTADGGILIGGQSASAPGANKTAPNFGGSDYWILKTGFGELGIGSEVHYFVAPNGQITGDGTKEKPWDLATATAPTTPVKPGDTIFLRGGIYAGNYMTHLRGTSNAPVTLRNYRNEHVIIDGYPAPWTFPLDIRGEWAIYQGLEVTQSSTWSPGNPTPVGIQCDAPNISIVNCVIHDAGQGIGFWDSAVNSEIYGCIIYHNGSDGQEHGIYTQNDVGTKRIHDNIIFNNSGFGIHSFTRASQIRGFDFRGNIVFNNGNKFGNDRHPNIFVGGFPPADRITVVSNFTFHTPGLSHFNILVSDRDHASNPNGTLFATDNYIVGGTGFTAWDYLDVTFRNNTILETMGHIADTHPAPGVPYSSFDWDFNTYAVAWNGAALFFTSQLRHFPEWQAETGLDANSTFQIATPSTSRVFSRPNRYEPGRGHIAVYNWGNLLSVPADLSEFGLAHGQRFEIRNAQNYANNGNRSLGTPVVTANYDSNQPVVLIPMTTAEALAVADPGHPGGYIPPTTFPLFGAFVVSPPVTAMPTVETPPVSHWEFDEQSGDNALDSSSSNHGTLVGNPTRVAGRSGPAILFDGANDYIRVPHSPSLTLGQNMSITMWLNPSIKIDASSGRKDIMQKFTSYWLMLNFPQSDGRLAFVLSGGSPAIQSARTEWFPNTWYHIAATLNNQTMSLYVNGNLETAVPVSTQPWTTGNDLLIGGNTVDNRWFPGILDDVRVYNVTLNAEEILSAFRDSNLNNAAPEISDIADQVTTEDTPTAPIPLAISDDLTSPESLEVEIQSSNPSLIPPGNVVITGTGANRHLVLSPYANQFGTSVITVTVFDALGLDASDSFHFTVISENDPPVITPIPSRTIIQGTGPSLATVAVTDVETPPESLAVTAASSNPILFPPANLSISGTGEARSLSFEPAPGMTGTATITVTVTDTQTASSQSTFTVIVSETNQPPTLSQISAQVIDEDSTAGPVPFTATDVETEMGALVLGVFSSNQSLLPNLNILLGGNGVTRSLILTPLPQQSGSVTVSYWVRDQHGTSVTNSFTLTVNPVNDPPIISDIDGVTVDQNQTSEEFPFTVADHDTAAVNLTVTASSSNPALIPLSGIQLTGTGFSRSVRITPAADQVGTASVTLTVSDGQSTDTTTFLILVQEAEALHPNLVAHWRFDELSGLVARDSIGTNNGVLLNGTSRVIGKTGYGISVNGINQVVDVPYSPTIALQPPMTIAVWFKPSELLNNNDGRKDLLQKFVSYWFLFNYPTSDGRLTFGLNSGTPLVKSVTSSWEQDRWYHVAATYGDGAMKIYVDGVLEGTTVAWGFIFNDLDYGVQFGGNTPQGVYFPGALDDVRLFNAVLTQQEITNIVANSITPNNSPSIGNIPNMTTPEDTPLGPFDLEASDQETDPDFLIVTATSSNPGVIAPGGIAIGRDGSAYTLTLTPLPNASGSSTITVTVTDTDTAQATANFVVTVSPVNDPPTLAPIADIQVPEDASTGFILLAIGDAETPVDFLVLSAQSSNPFLVDGPDMAFSGTGPDRVLQILPAPNASGSSIITVTLADSAGATTNQSFILTVTGINDPPGVAGLANPTINQDSGPQLLSFRVEDPDSPSADINIAVLSGNESLLPAASISIGGIIPNLTLSFTPAPGQHGMGQIFLILSDQAGATNIHSVIVTVLRFNELPTLAGLANITTEEDIFPPPIPFTVGDEFTPLNNLTLSASSSNEALIPNAGIFINGTGAQRMLSLLPTTNAFGNAVVTVTVTDGDGGTTSASLELSVSAVNDLPELSTPPGQTIEQSFTTAPLPVTVNDLETPPASLLLSGASSNPSVLTTGGIALGGTGSARTVTLTPVPGAIGTANVTLTVSDGTDTTDTSFTLTVVATNTYPSISGPPTLATDEDTLSAATPFTVADQETAPDQLVVTASSANTTLIPNPNIQITGTGATRTVRVIGATNAVGSTTLTLTVTDSKGDSVSTPLVATINPVNDAPTLSAIEDQTSGKGQTTDPINFLVSDLESDPGTLTVTATADNPTLLDPANILLGGSGTGRTLQLTPTTGESGTTLVTVTVSDGQASSSGTFTWLVEDVAPPPPGVVSWWNFDEESGLPVLDAQGVNPGTLTLGATRGPGLYGNGLVLDGQNDYVNIADSPSLDFSTAMSFSLWFKPAINYTFSSQRRDLLSKFTSYWLILNYPNLDGKITFVLNSGAPVIRTTTASWDANRWYHLVGTYDGALLRIYVNGAMENEMSAPGVISQNAHPFTIGGTPSQGQFVSGMMDDVMLFNRALAPAEVASMFANAGGGNAKPVISDLANLTLDTGTSSAPLPFTVQDAETAAASLNVTATSSDTALLPLSGIVFGGTGINRTVTLTPTPGESGATLVTVTVTDAAGGTDRTTFLLTVNGMNNQPPTITPITDRSTFEDLPHGPVPFTVNDPETPSTLTVTATSSDQTLLPNGNIQVQVIDGSGSLTLTPAPNMSGSTLITVTVNDPEGQSAVSTFNLSVQPQNDAPVISAIPNQIINQDSSTAELPFNISDVETPAGSLIVQAGSSNPALVPFNGISILGTGGARRIKVTPAPGQSGQSTIIVSVTDGNAAEVSAIFNLTVLEVQVPINVTITRVGSQLRLSWNSTVGSNYRVQWRNSVESGPWNDLAGDILALGSSTSIMVDALPQQARFYNVRKQ